MRPLIRRRSFLVPHAPTGSSDGVTAATRPGGGRWLTVRHVEGPEPARGGAEQCIGRSRHYVDGLTGLGGLSSGRQSPSSRSILSAATSCRAAASPSRIPVAPHAHLVRAFC